MIQTHTVSDSFCPLKSMAAAVGLREGRRWRAVGGAVGGGSGAADQRLVDKRGSMLPA